MILSDKDRRTELFASGAFIAAFQGFEQQAAKWPYAPCPLWPKARD